MQTVRLVYEEPTYLYSIAKHKFIRYKLIKEGKGKSAVYKMSYVIIPSQYIKFMYKVIDGKCRLSVQLVKIHSDGNEEVRSYLLDEIQPYPLILKTNNEILEDFINAIVYREYELPLSKTYKADYTHQLIMGEMERYI